MADITDMNYVFYNAIRNPASERPDAKTLAGKWLRTSQSPVRHLFLDDLAGSESQLTLALEELNKRLSEPDEVWQKKAQECYAMEVDWYDTDVASAKEGIAYLSAFKAKIEAWQPCPEAVEVRTALLAELEESLKLIDPETIEKPVLTDWTKIKAGSIEQGRNAVANWEAAAQKYRASAATINEIKLSLESLV